MTPHVRDQKQRPTLLVIDDEDLVRRSFVRMLAKQGFNAISAGTGQEALDIAAERPIALSLVDIHLPDMRGDEVIREMRTISPQTALVAMTGQGGADVAFKVLAEGACDYFVKPIQDWKRFYHVIRKNLEFTEKDTEVRDLRARLERLVQLRDAGHFRELIGNSEPMNELKQAIGQVGALNVAVLIQGESGVGKERVARALHDASKVREGPFVWINCAGLQRELLESELFGYERGAFTGAEKTKTGLCEVAENGTIFLDEIGDLPVDTQAKLLRVLNEREFRRVGGTRTFPLKARVISATNVDLRQAIKDGRFREDLFFRLNVFELQVPPLRGRKDDIPLLAYYFLQKYNKVFEQDLSRIAPTAMTMLQEHDYRENNVRELEHMIQRAVALALDETELGPQMLTALGGRLSTLPRVPSTDDPMAWDDDIFELSYQEAKNRVITEFSTCYLEHRLAQSNNNITRAAELSGMLRPNFAKLMRRFDVTVRNRQKLKG